MPNPTEFANLVQSIHAGRVSRRQFVARAMSMGVSALTIGTVLAACASREEPAANDDDLGPIEPRLNIYNWSDYIAEEAVPNFEKEFGVEVTYDTYESNEEMVAKLQAGASGYDLIVPTGYMVPVLISSGLIAPLKRQYLTNWSNVAADFLDPVYDPGNLHTCPWQWGTTGYAYRTDRLPAPQSWAIFHDRTYRGKMTMMDDGREVIGSMLRYRGHSLNSLRSEDLAQAKADAISAKQNLKAYISAPVKGQLVSGDVWVAQLWNGDTEQARAEQPNIGYVIPTEGCTIWTDYLVMLRSAPNKRAAHEFINYILRPEVGAAISDFTGYGTPNREAFARMKRPVPYPTTEEAKRLEYQVDLGSESATWDRLWTEIKSA